MSRREWKTSSQRVRRRGDSTTTNHGGVGRSGYGAYGSNLGHHQAQGPPPPQAQHHSSLFSAPTELTMMAGGGGNGMNNTSTAGGDGISECGLTEILENAFDHNPRPLPSTTSGRRGGSGSYGGGNGGGGIGGAGGGTFPPIARHSEERGGRAFPTPMNGAGVGGEQRSSVQQENASLLESLKSLGPLHSVVEQGGSGIGRGRAVGAGGSARDHRRSGGGGGGGIGAHVRRDFVAARRKSNSKLMHVLWLCGLFALLLTALSLATRGSYGYGRVMQRMKQRRAARRRDGTTAALAGVGGTNGVVDRSHVGVAIPDAYANLVDVDAERDAANEVPLFWHVPRSGGTTLRDVLSQCFHLTLAGGYGPPPPSDASSGELRVISVGEGTNYVNVDTYQAEGIQKATELNLVQSGLADVVLARPLLASSSMFSPETRRGRMFALLRHPVDRAASWFHFVQDRNWRRNRSDLADISIEEYFKSGSGEVNWMTRFLSGQMAKRLTETDLDVAKEVLRRKCLVGLLEEKGESMARFERMFGWSFESEADAECQEKHLQWSWSSKHRHEPVEEGSELWNIIANQNEFDMKLYSYAKDFLFSEQRELCSNKN